MRHWLLLGIFFYIIGWQENYAQPLKGNTSIPLSKRAGEQASRFNRSPLGENVFVFDPSMNMAEIQALIDTIYSGQLFPENEFTQNRYALLFKPGVYHLDVKVGYYTHVMGLGISPEETVIVGAVRSVASQGGHVLCNFWRAAENITILPASDSVNTWAVSQASPLRRVYIKGDLKLFDGPSSGGFMANCRIDGKVYSGSQQQWLTRNSVFNKWIGGVWNMVYVGTINAPEENWPEKPYTAVAVTPEVREKPYWVFSGKELMLKIPGIKKNSCGVDWNGNHQERTLALKDFYIAKAAADNSKTINKALKKGKHILFTPGIYFLSESIRVFHPGTVIIGLGFPTLIPVNGNKVIEISDKDGITVAGLLIDAGKIPSETLMQVGEPGSKNDHESNPSFLFDLFFRVGGAREGNASRCLTINSNDVYVDHMWIWRADHGNGVGWNKNRCANGLVVNGNDVTIYGLFNEHFQEYQTIWNGENGRVYFYQSEMPYDPPSVDEWKHGTTFGYASYKVADSVNVHHAWGLGIYNVFYDAPIVVDQAIETPPALEDSLYHKVIFWLNGNRESIVKSIINGKGGYVNASNRKAVMK